MNFFKNYLFGIIIFVVSLCVFLVIVSGIFAYTNINDGYIDSAIFFSMSVSSFIASFFISKKLKKRGMIHGVVINVICVLILFLIASDLNNSFKITNTLGVYLGICLLMGVVGGILGVNV